MDARAADATLALVARSSPALVGPDAKVALERLETSSADFLATATWLLEAGRRDDALRFANDLYRFWMAKQRFAEGATLFDRILAEPDGDERLRGRAYLYAGFMQFWMGDDAAASDGFGRALEIGRRLDDAPLTSQALGGLARVALRSDVPEGRRLAHEALAVSSAADDEAGRSNALHLLGVGAQIAGDLPEARDWMVQRLALVRSTGNEFLIGSEAANLSMVERQLGNLDAAEDLAHEALEIDRRTGEQFTTPFALSGLASIALERGDPERAAILIGAAEAIMAAQQMAWPPDERPHYERLLSTLPITLGSADFERARRQGRSTPTSDIVDQVLASHRSR